MSSYAWLITKDHLTEPGQGSSDAGINGPRDATEEQLARLWIGEGHTFKLYDDDGELYYTGRLIADDMDDEDILCAPLDDFGSGWAGCTLVRWPGHSEWNCEG